MKGKFTGRHTGRGSNDTSHAENVALAAFNRLIAEPERLAGFLAVTGLRPDTIRQAAAQPGFYAAILDHVSSDEELLLAIAGEIGLDPAEIAAARARLSPEATFEP
ncbi:DUF3572 domain-containing protein [Enterovirga aerilata]|uniref:DUF3572 domain-containing protein n=1 Tax=Enterovirga aerilata TaxID=2730920 RepID=A0A849HYE6_9HYPH|nr:DUF3572 domain-containing protein [Enterovirga sp. DB1703]NNM72132.1 DUF3572 domain-containing protein [Enterovirga sp. DB1703]